MRHLVEIENIDELRRREGIADVELQEEIQHLQVGDHVKLTFLASNKTFAGETLAVRITGITGTAFRGKLVRGAVSKELPGLRAGYLVRFTAEHIHSLAGRPSTRQRAEDP